MSESRFTCTSCSADVSEDANFCPNCDEAFDGFEDDKTVTNVNIENYSQNKSFDADGKEAFIRFAFFPLRIIVTAIEWCAYSSPFIGLLIWISTGYFSTGFLIFAALILLRIIGMIILSPLLMMRSKYPGIKEEGEARQGFLEPHNIPVDLMNNCPKCGNLLKHVSNQANCKNCHSLYVNLGFYPSAIESVPPILLDYEYWNHFKANPEDESEEPFERVEHWHDIVRKLKERNNKSLEKEIGIFKEFIKYINAKRHGENAQERYLKASPAFWRTIKEEAERNSFQLLNFFLSGFPVVDSLINKFFMMTIFTDGYALHRAVEKSGFIKGYEKVPNLWNDSKLRDKWYQTSKRYKNKELPAYIKDCIFGIATEIGNEIYLMINPDDFNLKEASYSFNEKPDNKENKVIEKFKNLSNKEKIIYFKRNQLSKCRELAYLLLTEGYLLRKAELSLLK